MYSTPIIVKRLPSKLICLSEGNNKAVKRNDSSV